MRKKLAVIFVSFLLLFGLGCGNTYSGNTPFGKAVDFQLEDINGKAIKLSDYSGKVIILNFFGTWCPPCRAEMPAFNEISKEYKNDVEVIAISVGGDPTPKVKSFAEKHNLTFTVAVDDGKVSRLYGPIRAIPVTVIIDKDFNIAKKYIGARSKEVFVKDVTELSR
ncbi:MAG: TlpA family protein disulfide reductase [Candidatus Omnitrophica bacterium]|nr:TlpA family protein disulfide reductase [Candidatus Omnitrophota bacterium]